MKKQKKPKKQFVQINLWGEDVKKRKHPLPKAAQWNFERDLVIRMTNEAKIRKDE